MAADGIPGVKGNPQFLGAGAPATAVDLNLISTWSANNIDRRVTNTTERDAIALKYVGMIVQTADTNSIWLCTNASGSGTWYAIYEDTGWQELTLTAGATVSGGLTPSIRRINRVVYIRGQMTATGSGGLLTVPTGYRIGQNSRFACLINTSGATPGVLVVNTDGFMGTSAGALVNLSGQSWPADG